MGVLNSDFESPINLSLDETDHRRDHPDLQQPLCLSPLGLSTSELWPYVFPLDLVLPQPQGQTAQRQSGGKRLLCFFHLKDNCFTEFYCFLSNINMNQPYIYKKWKWSCSVVSDSLQPHGLEPTRFLCPWDFPGKDTGVGCYFLLQEIFPTQGSNLGLTHWE